MSSKESNLVGCFEMYGAHIRLCIRDFVILHKKALQAERHMSKARYKDRKNYCSRTHRLEIRLSNYYSARDFLFGGGLDDAIERFGLPINASYIRRITKELAENGAVDNRGRRLALEMFINNGGRHDNANKENIGTSATW